VLFYRILEELSESNYGKEKSVDVCSDLFYYIKAHCNEDISLDLLAERYGYTKDYLIRLFKRRYGDTPMNFLVSSRMENAASLILHTDVSVTEIAYAVGYTDYSVFYKNFLKYHKISPSEYKKRKRE
jgi:AraC-like DNA-binding protein